jgi:hypothetical protein
MLNITKGKLKDRTGRRITGHYARIGDVCGQGETPAGALEALHAQLTRMCLYRSPQYYPIDRYLLIICPAWDALGCTQLLVFPDGHVSEQLSIETEHPRILQSVQLHVAQLLWAAEETQRFEAVTALMDEQHKRELNSWLRFQNAYKAARARGLSDTDAHREACYA